MYPWLANTINTILDGNNIENAIAMSWDSSDYFPRTYGGEIITPLGMYNYESICDLVRQNDIRGLAKEFFIWDNRMKNALFYRNSALALMWHDCYFMPSRRSPEDAKINNRILTLLKEAAKLDEDLPFPKREYLELCRLAGKKPMDVSRLSNYRQFRKIGYRRGMVIEHIGPFLLPIPGKFIKGYDNDNYAIEFTDPKEYGYVTTYSFKPFRLEPEEDFADIFSAPDQMEMFRFNTKTTRVKAALYHSKEDIAADYNILAQVVSGRDMLLASFQYNDPDEQDLIIEILRNTVISPA